MKTNICLIGAGRMGSLHAHHISKSKKANLHSVVDINFEQGSKVASMYGAKFYNSVQKALSDTLVEAVLISTTTLSHADLIIECAEAGMGILCEKPIDTDIKNIERAF